MSKPSTTGFGYLGSAALVEQLAPLYPHGVPQIAVAGPSNVGKSSVVNALLRAKVAYTSKTPGRTQTVNFFRTQLPPPAVIRAADKSAPPLDLVLADVPGYGFAQVPVAQRRGWRQLLEAYLTQTEELRAVIILHDIRREWTDADNELAEYLSHQGKRWELVLTKADKFKRGAALAAQRALAAAAGRQPAQLPLFSALTGAGFDDILTLLWQLTADAA